MSTYRRIRSLVYGIVIVALGGAPGHARHGELPNRIPEAAPYNVTEAESYPPPYEEKWTTINNPGLCAGCHTQIFQESGVEWLHDGQLLARPRLAGRLLPAQPYDRHQRRLHHP